MDILSTRPTEPLLSVVSGLMTRVLVVDDDHSVSMAIQLMLARHGCDAVLAPDAYAGQQAFEALRFDVAMVDIFIPGTDGLKIIKGFRERAATAPIIAMSGFRFRNSMSSTLDFLGMAAQLGANYCLRKPFTSQQLMVAINSCLDTVLSTDGIARSRNATQGEIA